MQLRPPRGHAGHSPLCSRLRRWTFQPRGRETSSGAALPGAAGLRQLPHTICSDFPGCRLPGLWRQRRGRALGSLSKATEIGGPRETGRRPHPPTGAAERAAPLPPSPPARPSSPEALSPSARPAPQCRTSLGLVTGHPSRPQGPASPSLGSWTPATPAEALLGRSLTLGGRQSRPASPRPRPLALM